MTGPARPQFDPAVATARLQASGQVWWPVHHWQQTDSTQNQLRQLLLRDPAPLHAWRLGVADAQTAGRGRQGAAWLAPVGSGLLLTLGGHLNLAPARWPQLSLLAGLAVLQVLNHPELRLKWPNDVVVQRDGQWHKLAGLLCEQVQRPGQPPAWLCGLGLNLGHGADLPPTSGLAPMGLLDVGIAVPADELAARLASHIRQLAEAFAAGQPWPHQALDAVLAWQGQSVWLDFGPAEPQQLVTLVGLAAGGGLRWQQDPGGEVVAGTPLACRAGPGSLPASTVPPQEQ